MAVEGKLPLKLPPAFPLVAAAGPGISCLALRGAVSPAGLAQSSSTRLSSTPTLCIWSPRTCSGQGKKTDFPALRSWRPEGTEHKKTGWRRDCFYPEDVRGLLGSETGHPRQFFLPQCLWTENSRPGCTQAKQGRMQAKADTEPHLPLECWDCRPPLMAQTSSYQEERFKSGRAVRACKPSTCKVRQRLERTTSLKVVLNSLDFGVSLSYREFCLWEWRTPGEHSPLSQYDRYTHELTD